jgi:signal transduction histidine kinase
MGDAFGWIVAAAAGAWALRLRTVLAWRMELVARACHELRGPITVAGLGLELIARDAGRLPETVRAIELELAGASVALEDLSGACGGAAGRWRSEAVDVRALLADAVAAFRPLAEARGVELGFAWRGGPGVVHGDRVRLSQAAGNLIANAIEHGSGRVALHGRRGDSGLELAVTDAGPGLPAPVAEIAGRARGGRGRRGRGLAIAAEIARRHGGRLVARADASGALRATLLLPVGDAPGVQ